jgi:hypothetical protein
VTPADRLDEAHSWHRLDFDTPRDMRRAFRRRLFREMNTSGLPRVLMSDEALYGAPAEALARLRTFTDRISTSLRVVVYLRRQDDHLVSRYQQVVKVGEVRRLADRVEQLDLTSTYDYRARLAMWEELLAPTDFVVRRFERASFVEGSLYQDFLDAAGIDVRAGDLEPVERVNESLDAESVELLRILNIYRVEHEGARAGMIDNRALVERLAECQSGPTLTLPDEKLDEFMALWEHSNREVARRYFGEPAGQLFRTQRKTTNTTADQRLDPARLDHYLAVLELPERIHAPLRALVEREASAR